MNQLRPLNVPEDPDDVNFVDVIEEDAGEDADGSQNGLKDKPEEVTEEKAEDDDEPKIEDVIDSSSAPKKNDFSNALKQDNLSPKAGNESNELEELSEDIFHNLGVAIQITEDFKSGAALMD